MGAAVEKFMVGGLLLLLALAVLAHGGVESWAMALVELSLLALTFGWGLHCVAQGRLKLVFPNLMGPLLGLFLMGLFASVAWQGKDGAQQSLSWDVEATRLATLTLGCMLIAFLLFANYLITAKRVLFVTNCLIVFGFALALFGLLQRFTWNGKFYWVREPLVALLNPFGPFVNRNHFAGFVEMLLPLPLAMVWMKCIRPEQRVLYVMMTVLMGVAVFVSLSRGGMVSVVVSMIFVALAGTWAQQRAAHRQGYIATKGDRRHMLMRFASLGCLLLVMAAGVWWMAAEPMLERVARTQLSGEAEAGRDTLQKSRGYIWQSTLRMIAAQPLLGVGFGAYETAYPQYSQDDSSSYPVAQAHNDYLQIVADCGLVGGLLALWFVVLLARAVWHGLQHQDVRLAALSLGAGGGLCALLVHSLFDFNLQLPSNAMLFLWLAALVSVLGVPTPASKTSMLKVNQVGSY